MFRKFIVLFYRLCCNKTKKIVYFHKVTCLSSDGFFVPHGYLSDDEGDEDCTDMTEEAKQKRIDRRREQVKFRLNLLCCLNHSWSTKLQKFSAFRIIFSL